METATGPTRSLPPQVVAMTARMEQTLDRFLAEQRAVLGALDPTARTLVDELSRLVGAGGKRLRPIFCYLGYRAVGGVEDEPIVRAAAALELLHTFALVHDDLMDASTERRGVETTHVRFARGAGDRGPIGAEAFGRSVAILVGDLAAVLSEILFRTSGFGPDALGRAAARFDRMRLEMAAGQFLDLAGGRPADDAWVLHLAELKTGSYTVEGPLLIGAALAMASPRSDEVLLAYARPAGEAFQLRDDVMDGDAAPGTAGRVNELVDLALAAMERADLEPVAVESLRSLVGLMRLPG